MVVGFVLALTPWKTIAILTCVLLMVGGHRGQCGARAQRHVEEDNEDGCAHVTILPHLRMVELAPALTLTQRLVMYTNAQ